MDLDDTNLENIIASSSNLSHEQIPVAGASSVSQDESRRLNEMTPEYLDSLKKQVYEYARKDKWKEAESIFNKHPDMVRIPLTVNGEIALHVAVDANSINFVKGLVNLMTPQDCQIRNSWGNTASLVAAWSGNSDLVQIISAKYQDPGSIKGLVWEYASKDKWKEAESIFNKHPDMVRIPLTVNGEIALHVAVDANSINFVKGLVNLMTPQDCQIRNIWGNTASLVAASSGNSDLVQIISAKYHDPGSLKGLVWAYARKDKWKEAASIFNEYPHMVRIPLTVNGEIALHVAVDANSINFVKGLVNLMTPQDCQIRNSWGNTASLVAASSGNSDLVQIISAKYYDPGSLKGLVWAYARKDKWKEAESIFNKHPDMVRIPLTVNGEIALHVAVDANSINFVKGLVNLMTPQDCQIRNIWGNTASLVAAWSGNNDLVQIISAKYHDPGSLRGLVWAYARKDKWKEAASIFNEYPHMVRIPLTVNGEIALHVAVDANSINFVKGLVNLMTPEDRQIKNSRGKTAFFMAAESGNSDLVQIMIEKNKDLDSLKKKVCEYARKDTWNAAASIFNKYPDMVRIPLTGNGDTALRVAVEANSISFMKGVVGRMTLPDLKIQNSDIEEMFFETMEHNMFDMARQLYEKCTDRVPINHLAGARNGKALTMLLRKPSKKSGPSQDSMQLLQKIWSHLRTQLKWEEILELIGSSSLVSAMADALESGNVEAVKWLLRMNRQLLTLQDDYEGQNILHYAVRQRHSSIVSYIFKQVAPPNDVLQAIDNDGNNILHLAGYYLKKEENSSSLRATTKMTREVAWFKEVEENAPPELRTMKNSKQRIPEDIFIDTHKELSKEVSEEVKGTAKEAAESGMPVAALVATVAFAAALVVPGDKTNPWFTVFILANAAALFTSTASILSFLSNFTMVGFADSKAVESTQASLIYGYTCLFISIVTMIISFAAASFLIFEHTSKRAAYAVASMGVFPILLFLLLKFRFLINTLPKALLLL